MVRKNPAGHRKRGEKALKTKRQGRPAGGKLTKEQAAGIRKSILGRYPDQLRLLGLLWTREKEKYPAISRQAREENAQIWWGYETGLRSDHQTGTTWGEKGKTPLVKGTGRRFGCNMISAITNQGDLRFMVFDKRFTVGVFLEFLDRLVWQQASRKVFLIVDRHAVHKATKVAKWLAENEDKIRLFFLPAYSPELNPDELLNQDLKSNAFRQGRAKDKQDMMSKTRAFLRSNQRRPGKVRRYFDGPRVADAAAA